MSARPERKLTYDDYARFPDDERWELIDGEAGDTASPLLPHGLTIDVPDVFNR